jgi:hypothetical protein
MKSAASLETPGERHSAVGERWKHPERAHGVGAHAPGGPLRRRRAAERRAENGSQLFERSEFCETPPVVSSAGKPEGPVTSARRGQGPQRRPPAKEPTHD